MVDIRVKVRHIVYTKISNGPLNMIVNVTGERNDTSLITIIGEQVQRDIK